MNNELIKKAYEHFNGVWPEGWESVIVSTEKNSTWCEGQYQNYPYKEDIFNVHLEYLGDSWKWVGTKADFDAYGESLKEEWMPDPDSMCEIKHDNEILSWKRAKYIGVNTDGSKVYAVVFLPYLSEYKNYKLDDNLKFRPLKTEDEKRADEMFDIVKDATDLYHACELLVKEGFKKCAA